MQYCNTTGKTYEICLVFSDLERARVFTSSALFETCSAYITSHHINKRTFEQEHLDSVVAKCTRKLFEESVLSMCLVQASFLKSVDNDTSFRRMPLSFILNVIICCVMHQCMLS